MTKGKKYPTLKLRFQWQIKVTTLVASDIKNKKYTFHNIIIFQHYVYLTCKLDAAWENTLAV